MSCEYAQNKDDCTSTIKGVTGKPGKCLLKHVCKEEYGQAIPETYKAMKRVEDKPGDRR